MVCAHGAFILKSRNLLLKEAGRVRRWRPHTFNSSSREAKAGRSLNLGPAWSTKLVSEFQNSQSHTENSCLVGRGKLAGAGEMAQQ